MAPLGHVDLTKMQKLLKSKNKNENENKNENLFSFSFLFSFYFLVSIFRFYYGTSRPP